MSQNKKLFERLPVQPVRTPWPFLRSLSQGELQRHGGILHLHFDQVTLLGEARITVDQEGKVSCYNGMEWDFLGIACNIVYIYMYIYIDIYIYIYILCFLSHVVTWMCMDYSLWSNCLLEGF